MWESRTPTLPSPPRDRCQPANCISIPPSASKLTLKCGAVFVIGVELHGVGRDYGSCWHLSPALSESTDVHVGWPGLSVSWRDETPSRGPKTKLLFVPHSSPARSVPNCRMRTSRSRSTAPTAARKCFLFRPPPALHNPHIRKPRSDLPRDD